MKTPFVLTLLGIISLNVAAGAVEDVYLTSSYDGKTTWSQLMIPNGYDPGTPTPLVLSLHGAICTPVEAVAFVRQPCEKRGWIIAAPHTHGDHNSGMYSFAALPAQHDCIDLLVYAKENYNIDEDRIFVTGISMGGQMTTVMAEKYPHLFAAAYEWMGPANMPVIFHELDSIFFFKFFADSMRVECEGTPGEVPMEYARRSPDRMTMNLIHVPFKICHGMIDMLVFPHHAEDLAGAIEMYDPLYFDGIRWFLGGHWIYPGDGEKACEYLEEYSRLPFPHYFLLRVDESKDYYCVDLAQHAEYEWSRIGLLQKPEYNELRLGVANGDLVLHMDAMYLLCDEMITLYVFHPEDVTLTFAEMNPLIEYTVKKGGEIYEEYEQIGDRLIITISSGSEFPERFVILPGSGKK